jgi:hypothetical protein
MAPGDLDTLEKVARIAKFNVTRYRIVFALAPMLARPKIGARSLHRIGNVLDTVEDRPNASTAPSLQRLIDRMRATIAELSTAET